MTLIASHQPCKNATVIPRAVIIGNFEIVDSAMVDGETWYTTYVIPRVATWIRQQSTELWYQYRTAQNYLEMDRFDLHETLYTIMALRWG